MLNSLRRALAAIAIGVSVFSIRAPLGAQVFPGEGGNCVSCTQVPVDYPEQIGDTADLPNAIGKSVTLAQS